jgi:hypothetical protein
MTVSSRITLCLVSFLIPTVVILTAAAQNTQCSTNVPLLECSQQQDCSQLQITQSCNESDKSCEALKASLNSLLAVQRNICETQNAKLREICETSRASLKAAAARCAAKGSAPAGGSLWDHNGSTVRLVADGTRRTFVYEIPRQSLKDLGVAKGTVLFEGRKIDQTYVGMAYVFSSRCNPRKYQVAGPVAGDLRQVTVYGEVSRVDQNCKEIPPARADVLTFTFLQD